MRATFSAGRLLLAMMFAFATTAAIADEAATAGAPALKVTRDDPRLDALIPPTAKIDVLADGFEWAEGPVWIRDGGYVLFSDIPNNRIMKWSPDSGLSVFMHPAGYAGPGNYSREPGTNGLTLDSQGRLVACDHGNRRVYRVEKNGDKTTLADKYQGKRFNSPNDLAYKSNGDLYFTDPYYGLPKQGQDPSRELDFCGVFRLGTDGQVTLLTREMTTPNGIAFSPDEKTLYVAQSDGKAPIIRAFELASDGTFVGPGRVFFDATSYAKAGKPGMPDGLKVDTHGNLFATGPGGVRVISPNGESLGLIETGDLTANCGWGGDGSTLYMTVNKRLMKIETTTKGARLP
jgi:gluconolactonase